MAEFTVKPEDYLPGGRLYNKPNIVVVSPEGVDSVTDKKTGITYVPGSRAVDVIQTGKSYEDLPENVKKILGGGGGYNPFATAQGYVYDEETGQFIVQTAPGNFSFLGGKFKKDASGNLVPTGLVSSGASGAGSNVSTAGTYTATDGKTFTNADAYVSYQANLDTQRGQRQSAYDLLYSQFAEYGLQSLVEPLKNLITEGVSPSEFTLRLRESKAYQNRFAANKQRVAQGLRALSEAEYIGLEDQYQNVMRNYGLPKEYYARGDMGIQQGFEKFIAGDVSAAELEDRIQTAQNRVLNAAPEVANTLRQFYPDIKDGDILAYALDPDQAITNIKRKVQAAEIGAGAAIAGLSTGLARAEELQRYGVTGEQARQGYQAIGGLLPRATQLGEIYAKSGMGPYTQTTAEAEVFGTPGAIEAERKRKQLAQLEQAAFSGKTGAAGGALARERAGQF